MLRLSDCETCWSNSWNLRPACSPPIAGGQSQTSKTNKKKQTKSKQTSNLSLLRPVWSLPTPWERSPNIQCTAGERGPVSRATVNDHHEDFAAADMIIIFIFFIFVFIIFIFFIIWRTWSGVTCNCKSSSWGFHNTILWSCRHDYHLFCVLKFRSAVNFLPDSSFLHPLASRISFLDRT